MKWLERNKRCLDFFFLIEVRGWVWVRVHTQEQDLMRTDCFATAKGRSTKALLSLCIDVGQREMRGDETLRLSAVSHQKLESENSGFWFWMPSFPTSEKKVKTLEINNSS